MTVRYSPREVHFAIDASDSGALSVSFPRFATARLLYVGIGKPDRAPYKTLLLRSGRGQEMQVVGNVKLQLGDGTQERCTASSDRAGRGPACV
jgi:hypothetical protein